MMVVLNSEEVCHDLLNKSSSKFSSRPAFPIYDMYELLATFFVALIRSSLGSMGWFSTAFLPYGKAWMHQRKLLNQFLYQKQVEEYKSIQVKETLTLLKGFAKDPKNYDDTINRYVLINLLNVVATQKCNSSALRPL
jgi:cytochrome P450